MSTPPKDRRTMPPLPAAGVHPLAHDEPSEPEAAGPGGSSPTLPGQPDASPAGYNNPKASAINMTLLELQGDTGPSEHDPAHSSDPVQGSSAHSEPDLPPPSVAPPPAEAPPALTPTANEPTPGAASGASPVFSERNVTEPTPTAEPGAPAAGFLSSPPPLAGRLERPSQRPSKPGGAATQPTTESPPSLTTVLIAAAVVSLLFGLLGAWAYDHFNREGKAQAEPAVVTAPPETPPGLSAAELEPLKLQLGELGQQVDAFEKELAQAKEKEPAPVDLTPIQQQIDGVAKSVAAIEPLAKRVEGITTRMEGLETSVKQLKDELGNQVPKPAAPKEEEKTSAPSTPLSNTPTAVPTVTDSSEAVPLTLENQDAKLADKALSEGVELFKAGKYEMAYAAFEKLEKTHPNDARVWYYAALSFGISQGDWGESTMNLVKKGVEREKAGTPPSAEIDAAFRDLNTGTGKEWLAFKRKDVTK